MKLLVPLLAVVALAIAAPAASAQYILDDDDDEVIITRGDQPSVAVEYSRFCLPAPFICSLNQTVSSSNGVTFTDIADDCAPGTDAWTYTCTGKPSTRITGGTGA